MPEFGDIIWIDFNPTLGREQTGRRPALVISDSDFNQTREMVVVCPITSKQKPYRMRVPLNAQTAVKGDIICEQLRTVDLRVRTFEIAGHCPDEIVKQVLDIVAVLLRLPS
jgi:mRNA interferase MazF